MEANDILPEEVRETHRDRIISVHCKISNKSLEGVLRRPRPPGLHGASGGDLDFRCFEKQGGKD